MLGRVRLSPRLTATSPPCPTLRPDPPPLSRTGPPGGRTISDSAGRNSRSVIQSRERVDTRNTRVSSTTSQPNLVTKFCGFLNHSINTRECGESHRPSIAANTGPSNLKTVITSGSACEDCEGRRHAAQRRPVLLQHVPLRSPPRSPAPGPGGRGTSRGNVRTSQPWSPSKPQPAATHSGRGATHKTKIPFQNAPSCAKPKRKI